MECFNESYEDFTKRHNYHEHRLYLKNQNCCDINSCNNLASDYDKLAEECHDTFKRYYETVTNGKIMAPTLCNLNEDAAKNFRIKASYFKNNSNIPSPLPNKGPILTTIKKSMNSKVGGKSKNKFYKKKSYKTKSFKTKSYKKKSYKTKSYKTKSYKTKSYKTK